MIAKELYEQLKYIQADAQVEVVLLSDGGTYPVYDIVEDVDGRTNPSTVTVRLVTL